MEPFRLFIANFYLGQARGQSQEDSRPNHHHLQNLMSDPRSRTPSFITVRDREKAKFRCDRHTNNRVVAKVIPVLLVGAAGFSTWVYIAQLCGSSPLH